MYYPFYLFGNVNAPLIVWRKTKGPGGIPLRPFYPTFPQRLIRPIFIR